VRTMAVSIRRLHFLNVTGAYSENLDPVARSPAALWPP
jgi:hypothetical protein